jgi:uncharacterized protein
MKFVPETLEGANMIARHESGPPARVWVANAAHERSLFVPWAGAVVPWLLSSWSGLSAADFERMAAFEPELVIFGSGARMRFAPPALLKPLVERRIGIECMDTAAACRTYNVLVSERRSVLAALLVGVD